MQEADVSEDLRVADSKKIQLCHHELVIAFASAPEDHGTACQQAVKAIGCSSLRGGGGELVTLKSLIYSSN